MLTGTDGAELFGDNSGLGGFKRDHGGGGRSRRRTQSVFCSYKQELEFCTSEVGERKRERVKYLVIYPDKSKNL